MTDENKTRPEYARLMHAALSFCVAGVLVAVAWKAIKTGEGSQTRLMAAIVLIGVAAYFALAQANRRLRYLNSILLINVGLMLAGAEVMMRLLQDRLPGPIVEMLPTDDRARLFAARGQFTDDQMTGTGLLYSYKALAKMERLPWLTIDVNGYRNRKEGNSYDIVLLGDSTTIAQESPRDMADFFLAHGLSALNLGLGGYSPFHNRDAYRVHVLNKKLNHRVVIINFCFCNDVSDAQAYARIQKNGGSWKDYLGVTPARATFPFAFKPPWTVSVLFHVPYLVVQKLRAPPIRKESFFITLPRGTIDAKTWSLSRTAKSYTDEQWGPALRALDGIISDATAHGARVVITYYPDLQQLYAPGFPDGSAEKRAAAASHKDATVRLASLAASRRAIFVDYTDALRAGNALRPIVAAEGDYHPNDAGVEIMVKTLLPILRDQVKTLPGN